MFYRENGQFKTTYRADQQILPIAQDRIAMFIALVVAFVAVPLMASDYYFTSILLPFLIFSLAAIGVNILVGYCGQISLGSGAFMAVGAYAAYNFFTRIEGMPLIVALILGGVCAMLFGILFGLPSLRVKGLYLAVATLAAQFFADWMFLRVQWFTNYAPSGSVWGPRRHQSTTAGWDAATFPYKQTVLTGLTGGESVTVRLVALVWPSTWTGASGGASLNVQAYFSRI